MDRDSVMGVFLCLLLIITPLMYILKYMGIVYIDIYSSCIFLIIFILFRRKFKKISWDILFLYLFVIFYLLIGGFNYNTYIKSWLGLCYIVILSTMPWYIISRNTSNYKKIINYLLNASYMITLSSCILLFVRIQLGVLVSGDMSLGYSILPACIISFFGFFDQKSKKHLLNFIFSLYIIIIYASRGPLLCILFYIFMYFLVNKRYRAMMCSFLIFLIFFINYNKIVSFTYNFVTENNIHSRTLYKLIEGTIDTDTGRKEIHNIVNEIINKNLFLGVGIGGERVSIYNKFYHNDNGLVASYPHNIFLELLVQYGILFGSIFSLLVIFIIISPILINDKYEKNLILILVSISIIRLLVSDSYLLNPYFFYLLGLSYNKYRKDK